MKVRTKAAVAIALLCVAGWTLGCSDDDGVDPGAGGRGGSGAAGAGGGSGGTGGSGGSAGSGAAAGSGGSGGGPIVECDGNCHYVRSDASGAEDGSDWTNAWTELPETLERGQIYYLADGSYAGRDFDTPEDGDSRIHLFKATAAHHGTATGWEDGFGDGTAELGTLQFSSSHWFVDGLSGSGTGGYGFTIDTGECGDQVKLVRLAEGVSDITVRHFELGHCGDVDAGHDIFYGAGGAADITVGHSYLHDVARCPFLMRSWQDVLIEHCVIENAGNSHGIHMEGISDQNSQNVTVRHNLWHNIAGTGIIILGDVSGYQIYGNVFVNTDSSYSIGGNGAIGTWSGSYADDLKIYNNSFVGVVGLNAGVYVDLGTGTEVYNNLWTGCSTNTIGLGNGEHDYNWFYDNWRDNHDPPILLDTDLVASEPHGQLGTADPLVDQAGGDFRLSAATDPGMSLQPPYDVDPLGVVRGADGAWDRGAFEFAPFDSWGVPSVGRSRERAAWHDQDRPWRALLSATGARRESWAYPERWPILVLDGRGGQCVRVSAAAVESGDDV